MYGSSVLVIEKCTEDEKEFLCKEGNIQYIVTLEDIRSQNDESFVISYESLFHINTKSRKRNIIGKKCDAMIL